MNPPTQSPARQVCENVQCLDPLRDARWDQRLAAGDGSVFHESAWAKVLTDSYGYRPLYFASSEDHALRALLPVIEVNSWLTGRRGVSLPFTDECQPLAADEASFQPLFDQAVAYGKARGWRYLELRGGRHFLPSAQASQAFYVHELDLVNDESAMFANLKSPVRRAIRKAVKCGLTIQISQDLKTVEQFYSLQCRTRRKHGLPPQPFRFFHRLHDHILAKGRGVIVLARYGGKAVAANLFLEAAKHATFKFGASDGEYQELRGSDLVMWAGLKHYATRGFMTMNFGRTSINQEGLRRFKLGWGARERLLEYFRFDLRQQEFVRGRDEAFGWYNRVFANLPASVSKLVGRLLYRHVA